MAFGSNNDTEIRIIKKKKAHAAHHGGAWKVAYADFVTAMMAFFLVMWITGMSDEVKAAIQGYFKDPEGFMKQVKAGNALFRVTDTQSGSISNRTSPSYLDKQRKVLMGAKERIVKTVGAVDPSIVKVTDAASKGMKAAGKGQGGGGPGPMVGAAGNVRVKMTNDGLQIDLLENKESLFFAPARSALMPRGKRVLGAIARELRNVENKVVIEGHTDNRPLRRPGYTNWELSTDRANAARSVMSSSGLRTGQISEVRGYADTQPLDTKNPSSPVNRRVSILVMYHKVVQPTGADGAARAEGSRGEATVVPAGGTH